MQCVLVIKDKQIVGVNVFKTFIPFEDQLAAEKLMKEIYQGPPDFWAVRREAEKIAQESKTCNDKVVEEILNVIGKHGLFPVAMG